MRLRGLGFVQTLQGASPEQFQNMIDILEEVQSLMSTIWLEVSPNRKAKKKKKTSRGNVCTNVCESQHGQRSGATLFFLLRKKISSLHNFTTKGNKPQYKQIWSGWEKREVVRKGNIFNGQQLTALHKNWDYCCSIRPYLAHGIATPNTTSQITQWSSHH